MCLCQTLYNKRSCGAYACRNSYKPAAIANKLTYCNLDCFAQNRKEITEKFQYIKTFPYLVALNTMSMRREIVAFGSYYKDFMATLHDKERRKVLYVLSLLEREDRLPIKIHQTPIERFV